MPEYDKFRDEKFTEADGDLLWLRLDGTNFIANDGVDFNGTTNTFSAVEGEINHDTLLNFVANKHIDWTNATEDLLTTGTLKATNLEINTDLIKTNSTTNRVGINSSPVAFATLFVNDSPGITSHSAIALVNADASSNSSVFNTVFSSSNTGTVFGLSPRANMSTIEVNSDVHGIIGNRRNASLSFGTADRVRMTIKASGEMRVFNRLKVGADSTPAEALDVAGNAIINGRIASGTLTITASSDITNVSGINTLFINITSDIILGGLRGGTNGQVVNIVNIGNFVNHVTIEHQEGITGSQDFINHTATDELISHGGSVYVFNGTNGNWYDCSHARHV